MPLFPSQCLKAGQPVEVWLAGCDQWLSGCVQQVGFLDGVACAVVRLDYLEADCVFRQDQLRAMEGLFSQGQ